jgi:decaprenyl-phosphate phosphoribosyltransferase
LAGGLAVLGYCPWALEEGGVPRTSVLPWRQLSMGAFVLAVLAVLRDRALACIPLVWPARYGLAVANW